MYNYIKDQVPVKNRYLIHKILVAAIILIPLFSWSGCKKQARCGCGKDVVSSIDSMLIDHSKISFGPNGASAYFSLTNAYGYYDTYYFCNPLDFYSKYTKMNTNDQMILSGKLFWECQFMMNSSNSYYTQYYKVYNIEVTQMEAYLYGKK
jgi:hypothetical protein